MGFYSETLPRRPADYYKSLRSAETLSPQGVIGFCEVWMLSSAQTHSQELIHGVGICQCANV